MAIATAERMEEIYSRFGACPMAQRISSNATKPQMTAMITPNSQMGAKTRPRLERGCPRAQSILFFSRFNTSEPTVAVPVLRNGFVNVFL